MLAFRHAIKRKFKGNIIVDNNKLDKKFILWAI